MFYLIFCVWLLLLFFPFLVIDLVEVVNIQSSLCLSLEDSRNAGWAATNVQNSKLPELQLGNALMCHS